MSTRSLIAYQNDRGSITSTYCHMDGYPSYNGAILLAHWNCYERAKELVNNGYISSLKFTIKDINESRADNDCSRVHGSEYAFVRDANALFHEYLYLYKDGAWWVSSAEAYDTPDGYQDRQYYHSQFNKVTEHVTPSDMNYIFGRDTDWSEIFNTPELKTI